MDKQMYIEAVIQNHITHSFSGNRIITFFKHTFISDLTDQLIVTLQKKGNYPDIKILIHNKIMHYIDTCFIQRSHKESCILTTYDKEEISHKLIGLQNIIQPKQKTIEWYQYRNNLITASNMYKVFGSTASQNSLIFEKCKIMDEKKNNIEGNTSSGKGNAMHWGIKYELVSLRFYEKKYDTTILEFGCLPHQTILHIGASPDGINNKKDNPRYGRMIEIKNTVSREITGIPKNEYWIQMQIQMEVCDLFECDFMETKFMECTESEYYTIRGEKTKGIIIQYTNSITYNNTYFYMDIVMEKDNEHEHEHSEHDIDQIQRDEIQQRILGKKKEDSTIIVTITYYYLHTWSCVLVQRNKLWFMCSKQKIEQLWNTIQREKESGYTHRAPKPRKKMIVHYEGFN
jgi:putative phage-type endonuclease